MNDDDYKKLEKEVLSKKLENIRKLCESVIKEIETKDTYEIYSIYGMENKLRLIQELKEVDIITGLILDNDMLELSYDYCKNRNKQLDKSEIKSEMVVSDGC